MDIKSIVAQYATKNEKGVEVNLNALAKDKDFQSLVAKEVVKKVKENEACVLIPAYKPTENRHLGKLINELALTLQVKTLVTGDVKNLRRLRIIPERVIILKQSFRNGKELKTQIEAIKEMGCQVSVLCLLAHSSAKLQNFAAENEVEINALVKTDN